MKHAFYLLMLLATPSLAGGVYTYTQKDGTVVYTNVPPGAGVKARKLKGGFTPAPKASEPAAVRPVQADDLEDYITSAARRYRIPDALVRAVMHAESNFNSHAISNRGASGLMQLMPTTAQDMYVRDIFDAKDNIEGGTRYLRVLANQFDGDMVKMVAAYNAGPDAVRKCGGNVPNYPETQDYVRKVLALYFQYKGKSVAERPAAPTPGPSAASTGTTLN
jgi:soluble lytic murein transglycosylase-like protein